jgi:diacylglycerol O-acyltransferase / wax synthase
MQQLTELDYTFIQQETNRTPMHICPVLIYEPRKGKKPVRFKEILNVFQRNLHKSAVFRRKLAGGAMGLDTPWWVEDPDFDLEFHVRHIALPKPGDWRQFCIQLARLHARGLDMKRPLWEAYVIEGLSEVNGLPKNSFALMLKIHHSAIDGVSGAEILTAIHSLSSEIEPPEAEDQWQGEADPSTMKVWTRAYVNNIKRPVKLLKTARELWPSIGKVRELNKHSASDHKGWAHTPFNDRVSSHRVIDGIALELSDVKTVKSAVEGATINDVIVSVVGGAMRRYLASKDQLPESSMSCGAPINARAERNSESRGNQVSMMMINMATDIDDALERLEAVTANARESKAYTHAIGANVMMDVSGSLTPAVWGIGLRAASLVSMLDSVEFPMQTVISNVPGVQVPLYMAGAKVHMTMGLGPLLDMMGLFHGVISGAGKITITFVSCREMMPDPEFYRDCLQDSWDELFGKTS